MSFKSRRLASMVLVLALMLVPVSASAAPAAGPGGALLGGIGWWSWATAKVAALVEAVGLSFDEAATETHKEGSSMVDLG